MSEGSVTTATIISFCEALEDRSAAFYEALAERWPGERELFLEFAQDSRKNRTQVVRTYQETISDALEASYSFEGMNLDHFAIDTALSPGASYADGLERAMAVEERAVAYYEEAAERSESLLATIPRAFRRVAKNRTKRMAKLQSLSA
jgi:rubrerythrin